MKSISLRGNVRRWAFEILEGIIQFPSAEIADEGFPVSPGFIGEPSWVSPVPRPYARNKDVPEIFQRILYFKIPQNVKVPFTWVRKYPVNLKGRLIEKGYCPDELENLSIGVLPEGYVFGVKSPSGTYFPDDPPAYTTCSYLEVIEKNKHIYFRRSDMAKPRPLTFEIMKEIGSPEDFSSPGLLNRVVHEQLKLFGIAPFIYYLLAGSLILIRTFEIAGKEINERSVIKYCSGCPTAEKWQNVLLKGQSFIGPHVRCNGVCYVELLQHYRENVGHVKQKMKIFEDLEDTKCFDYVETMLQYYFLEALFQWASWLVRPTGDFEKVNKYRKKIMLKIKEYQKLLKLLIEREAEKPPQEYGDLIIIKDPRKFASVLNKLLGYLADWISQKMGPKYLFLLEKCLKEFENFESFKKFYGNLISSAVSLIESLKSKETASITPVKEATYEDIYRELPEAKKIIMLKNTYNFTLEEETQKKLIPMYAAYLAYHKKMGSPSRPPSFSKFLNMVIRRDPRLDKILPAGFKWIHDYIEE